MTSLGKAAASVSDKRESPEFDTKADAALYEFVVFIRSLRPNLHSDGAGFRQGSVCKIHDSCE